MWGAVPEKIVVCVGTKRGLFLLESNKVRAAWRTRGPYLKGWQIYHAIIDTRATPKVHAAVVSDTFGATTISGELANLRLRAAEKPPVPPRLLPGQLKWIRKWKLPSEPRLWHIEPGRASEKGVLYAGTAPAALFWSEDDGRTWEEVKGLSAHPSRKDWTPGAGGLALHSIQLDPTDSNRMYVGISSAGVFRTDDGGKTWSAVNHGITTFEGRVLKKGDVGT